MYRILTAVAALFLFAGCAHSGGAAPAPAAPPGHQAEAPPPEPPASPAEATVTLTPAPGWARVPPYMLGMEGVTAVYMSPPRRAIMMVVLDTGTPASADTPASAPPTPEAAARALAADLASSGWTTSTVTTSADGTLSSFTLSNPDGSRSGKIAVRTLAPGATAAFMGQWNRADNAECASALDAMVASARLSR